MNDRDDADCILIRMIECYQRNQKKKSASSRLLICLTSHAAYRFPTAHGIHGYLTPRPTIGILTSTVTSISYANGPRHRRTTYRGRTSINGSDSTTLRFVDTAMRLILIHIFKYVILSGVNVVEGSHSGKLVS